MNDNYVGPLTGPVWGAGWLGGIISSQLPTPGFLLVWVASVAIAISIAVGFILLSERAA